MTIQTHAHNEREREKKTKKKKFYTKVFAILIGTVKKSKKKKS
jgi:hypothetical protein